MRPRYGLTMLVAATAIIGMAGSIWIVLRSLGSALQRSGVEAVVAQRIETTIATTLVVLALVAFGFIWIATRAMARALFEIRTATLARARGDADLELRRHRVRELSELAAAVDRLHDRVISQEAALAYEMREVAVAVDSVSEGIVRLDVEGRVLRTNPAARLLLGLGNDATGRKVATHVRHAELRRILLAAAAGETVPPEELSIDDRRVIVTGQPIREASGSAAGAVVSLLDLTELRRLEGVRRDFVANVSHELKTPLTSIRGYTETLLADAEMSAESRAQFLEVVHRNAIRLHSIVDDLLDLSRIESGAWRPDLHELDALTLINDVVSPYWPAATEREISLVVQGTTTRVIADPAALRQVLGNLIDNALRHTHAGGTITIRVAPTQHPGVEAGVSFAVSDTGTGIPSDALPRIFERFYRVDPARSRAEGGTGLGLAIVKHMVEGMDGEVSAESELGRGTTICFQLPAPQ